MRRVFLWFVPAGVGLATAAILAAGFAAGMSGRLGQPIGDAPTLAPTPTPAASANAGAFRIVALGDSLTHGTGDTENGGYPERVAAAIRKSGRSVVVENFAVDGHETGDFLRKVREADVKAGIAAANLILMSIGGNDLSHALEGRRDSGAAGTAADAPDSDPTAAALSRIPTNLLSILSSLRSLNPTAPIRLLGLYNPFPDVTSDQHIAKETLLKWNVALEEASFSVPNALVVPTADLFEGRPDRLSLDRFHPGPPGYDEIAARVVSTLHMAASAPAAPTAAAASGRQSGG